MNQTLLRRLQALAAACALALLPTAQANADGLIDPATLHIGPGSSAGAAAAEGLAGDPNRIGSGNTADIFQESGGTGATVVNPTLLILGIPNDSTNLFASNPISSVTFINPFPGGTSTVGTSSFATPGTYGLKSNVNGGFFGDMTSASPQVYSFLNLAGPTDASNSFTNWSGADLAIDGITASEFGVYVLALSRGSSTSLGPTGLIDLTFNPGSLPLGTFAVGYGQNGTGTVFDTPFTQAGLTTPEPGSLLFFGFGLVAIGFGLWRRFLRERVEIETPGGPAG